MRELTIHGRRIADDEPCYVISELGNNHGGSVDEAHKLIDLAATAGSAAVKFQRRHNRTLYSAALLAQPYENEASYGPTYGAHREALELPLDAYPELIAHAHEQDMACLCTAFDEASANDLMRVGIDAIKVASGSITDRPLLWHLAQMGVPLVVSTGGCIESDITRAAFTLGPCCSFAFLHCTASYPCRFDELNLSYIRQLRGLFPETIIGWSGHDSGIAMAVLAYAFGARIVEKHFTANRAQKGTDHAFSLEPDGMRKLCRDLGRCRDAVGDGVKRYYESERKPISKMRRRPTPDGLRVTGEVDR